MKNNRYAAIDIGTNTFRLFIAHVYVAHENSRPSFQEIYSERIVTRLGEGIVTLGIIREDAMMLSLDALTHFRHILQQYNVKHIAAVATSAVREAANSDVFLQRARKTAGIDIHIISGEEEARISAAGMLVGMEVPSESLMTDIGGGSTELIFARRGLPESMKSINLGVVYLANEFMVEDPPSQSMLNQMDCYVSDRLYGECHSFRDLVQTETTFIGTAGTITALSAMHQKLRIFDHDRIHNSSIALESIRKIYVTISSLHSRERAQCIPFEPARLDIIVPGTLILLKLMEFFNFGKITVSNYGLREGIILDMYKSSGCDRE